MHELVGIEELAVTACIGDVLRPEQAGIGHAQRKRHIESTCFYSLRISGQNASARIEHLQDVLQLVSCHWGSWGTRLRLPVRSQPEGEGLRAAHFHPRTRLLLGTGGN